MEKRIKPGYFRVLPLIVILCALCNRPPVPGALVAAVVPVDPGQELNESIRKPKRDLRVLPAQKTIATVQENDPVLIEVRKKNRAKKVFSAAQFVCGLPIETGTIKTVCKQPKDVEEALKKMKEEGFDEVWLKTPACGEVYNALVKSARELEIRINA